tara:strand:+ start:452 stop:697 length:246 start_codon:yes stop_codon:yes gene_type:complete
MITVTQHDKNEWSRMAKDAYANDVNYMGHRYSGAAVVNCGTPDFMAIVMPLNDRGMLPVDINDYAWARRELPQPDPLAIAA